MQTISITNLREMTGVELVVLSEIVQITSNKTVIGYFVPVEAMGKLREENERYQKALDQIASWQEGDTVRGNFDDPSSARIARAALEKSDV